MCRSDFSSHLFLLIPPLGDPRRLSGLHLTSAVATHDMRFHESSATCGSARLPESNTRRVVILVEETEVNHVSQHVISSRSKQLRGTDLLKLRGWAQKLIVTQKRGRVKGGLVRV